MNIINKAFCSSCFKRALAILMTLAIVLSNVSLGQKEAKVVKGASKKTLIVGSSSRSMIAASKKKTIYTYRSSKPKVASVSKNGVITCKKKGTVSIIRYKTKKKKTKIDKVQVFKVIKLSISGDATVYTGGSYQFTSNAKGVTWKVSDKANASISAAGVLSPTAQGSVKVTAKYSKKAKASKTVTILPDALDHLETVYQGQVVTSLASLSSVDKSKLRVYGVYKSGLRKEINDYIYNDNGAASGEVQITYGPCSVKLLVPKTAATANAKNDNKNDDTNNKDDELSINVNDKDDKKVESTTEINTLTTEKPAEADKKISNVDSNYQDQFVYKGEGFDLSKIRVEVTYEDGTKAYISPSDMRLGESYSEGDNCYTVVYYTVDGVEYKTMLVAKEKLSKPTSIELTTEREFLYVNEPMNKDDFVAKVTYSDGKSKIVSNWKSDYLPSDTATNKKITFEYEEDGVVVSTTKDIVIKSVSSCGIEMGKYVTNLGQGDRLNLSDLEVFEVFDDGSKKAVSGFTTDYDSTDRTLGSRTVKVMYGDYETEFNLVIDAYKIVSLKATSPSVPTIKGNVLNETGMALTAVYEDGSEMSVGGWTVDDTKDLPVGEHVINVYYAGLSCNMNVVVEDELSFKEYSKDVIVKHPLELIGNKKGLSYYVKYGEADVAVNEGNVIITPKEVGEIKVIVSRESTNESVEVVLNAVTFDMSYVNLDGGYVAKGDTIEITSNAPAQFSYEIDGDEGYFVGTSSAGITKYTFKATRTGTLTMTAKDSISGNIVNKTVLVRKELNISGSSKVAKGKSITLTSTKNVVTWSSSNTSIATVNQSGKVTGKKAGTVTITATFPEYGNRKVSKKITVTA